MMVEKWVLDVITNTNPKTGQKETCVLPNVGGAGSAHSRTEIFTELISEEEAILHQALTKRLTERRKLLIFIETIPDSQRRKNANERIG